MTLELREQPPSYVELVGETAKRHEYVLYAAGFLFFALVGMYGAAVIVHIKLVEIAALAQAEATTGEPFAENVVFPDVYLPVGLCLVAAVGNLHLYVKTRQS